MSSTRHYTVISQGDDFDELLPPADVRSPSSASSGGRATCWLVVGVVALLLTAVAAIALPLVLVNLNRDLHSSHFQQNQSNSGFPSFVESTGPVTDHVKPLEIVVGAGPINSSSSDHLLHSSSSSSEKRVEKTSDSSSFNKVLSTLSAESTLVSEVTSITSLVTNSTATTSTQNPVVTVHITTTKATTTTIGTTRANVGPSVTGRPEISRLTPKTSLEIPVSSSASATVGSHWLHADISSDHLIIEEDLSKKNWMKSLTSDPAFVPAASVAAVMMLLVVMVTAHALKRRADRRQRRRNIGRMITDLQSGDKVMLMSSDDD